MATSTKVGGEEESVMDINMTPLIDVLLVLLIYLIVNLPPVTHAIKMDLPRGTVDDQPKREIVDLMIDYDGQVYWNGVPVSFDTLQSYLQDAGHKDPKPELHFIPNPRAKYNAIATTLAVAQRSGVERIGLVGNEKYIE